MKLSVLVFAVLFAALGIATVATAVDIYPTNHYNTIVVDGGQAGARVEFYHYHSATDDPFAIVYLSSGHIEISGKVARTLQNEGRIWAGYFDPSGHFEPVGDGNNQGYFWLDP